MAVSNPRAPSIHPGGEQKVADCSAVALRALTWILTDEGRAGRLLALTGLSPMDLRTRIGEPSLLAAAIGFLEAHEADLIACADALGVRPASVVAAREALEA